MNGKYQGELEPSMVYYTFLTEFNGVLPHQVDELDSTLVQELLYIHQTFGEKMEKDMRRKSYG